MNIDTVVARDDKDPVSVLKEMFSSVLSGAICCDAIFKDASSRYVIGVSGLLRRVPVVRRLFSSEKIFECIESFGENSSILIHFCDDRIRLFSHRGGKVGEENIPTEVNHQLTGIQEEIQSWAGRLNTAGEHEVDLTSPSPGPHFNVNLLIGNRIDFPDSLQTTPKSVVNRFGGGSFRSHAATHVLAARWDMRAEENGFPANRQFYLLEAGKIIFYSAAGAHPNLLSAMCRHSQNFTQIFYRTACGLEIRRLIFVLPQKKGRPLAVESHRIDITHTRDEARRLHLVYTGMFGTAAPHALWEDVIYSNVIMQAKILRDQNHNLIAVGNDYYPDEFQNDHRFHTTFLHTDSGRRFPTQFCFDYTEFVGSGTLENPQNVAQLSNRLNRKGPGFFAVGMELEFEGRQTLNIDNFTGLVASPPHGRPAKEQYEREVTTLINDHGDPWQTERDLEKTKHFLNQYSECFQIKSADPDFDTYVNQNLPFQVLYQTYVSRSFGQTQKGYREIGFREIQDFYASIYYLVSMGRASAAKSILQKWIENIYEFGYANHNFFWIGKEPGKWSDDPLWLIPAVYRYINLTGDQNILDEDFELADPTIRKKRKLSDTIHAIITYCAKISIGRHGFPLLDSADWNDCLKIDEDFVDGPRKEKLYYQQIAEEGIFGDPLKSDYSESVMNAFLLKYAIDLTSKLFHLKGDIVKETYYSDLSERLFERIQTHAWKGDFFARVLLNRFSKGDDAYIGAAGDGFSADALVPGVYFLNSFSWSILSDCASEDQIDTMLTAIDKYLKTPYGVKLMTPAAFESVAAGTATGHYFSGDRENGAVFKHAAMMAVAAMLKASKRVADVTLAQRLASLAYWMIDLVLPYKTFNSPYQLCGNPRFCTQYINSETGENIGPLLSGTSTWLLLSLFSAYGLEFSPSEILLDPILEESQRKLEIRFNTGQAVYEIHILKPPGFFRIVDSGFSVECDNVKLVDNKIPLCRDHKKHTVRLNFFR